MKSIPLVDKKIKKEMVDGKLQYYKYCSICSSEFLTPRVNKNICSTTCKKQHNRQHSRQYQRKKREKRIVVAIDSKCALCDFWQTVKSYKEGNKSILLCPNHYCLITRNLKTLDQLITEHGSPVSMKTLTLNVE